MITKKDQSPDYKSVSQKSKKLLASFKKFKFISNPAAKSADSSKNKFDGTADLFPGQFLCLNLHETKFIEDIFLQRKINVIIFGDVFLVGLSSLNTSSNYLGILVSTGILFLYEYDKNDVQILYFRIGINIRGANVSLNNEIITVQSNLDILLKFSKEHQLDNWYQKLCEVSTDTMSVYNTNRKQSKFLANSRGKINKNISKSLKNHFQHIKDSWKFSESMKEITTQSWNHDQPIFTSLFGQENSQLSCPEVSDESFLIDSKFKISSSVLLRISSPDGSFFIRPFVKGFASLTQELLTLTTNKNNVSVNMRNCKLEDVRNLKWGIRIISPDNKIDVQLNSKTSYENWTLAFLKIFSFHSKSIGSWISCSNKTEKELEQAIENLCIKVLPLRRCHSWSIPSRRLSYKNITKSYTLLKTEGNIFRSKNTFSSQVLIDDDFKEPFFKSEYRSMPKRNSSCLDHPIPIPPNFYLSKSIINVCDSSSFEINTIYDEMETIDCDGDIHIIEDRNSTPLPIRCKKHGIKTRLRNSYQQFSRKLIKSELWKLEKLSNNFMGITSKKFQSESNLLSSNKLKNRNGHKNVKVNKKEMKGTNGISNMWNSVLDMRDKTFDIFKRRDTNDYTQRNSDIESAYEEPLCTACI